MKQIPPTTIRLPVELEQNIVKLAKQLGFSKADLVKNAILRYLITDELTDFEEIKIGSGEFRRIGIRFNDNIKAILQYQAKQQGVSVNSLIIYATNKTYEYYSKLLAELGLK